MPYYAVAEGRNPGIYDVWDYCKEQVNGYSNACFRRFTYYDDAVDFINEYECPYDTSLTTVEIDGTDFVEDHRGYVVVYADGACSFNGQYGARAGIGVWFGYNHEWNLSARLRGRQTNIRAEIQAIVAAARRACNAGVDSLVILTDSHHAVDCYYKWDDQWEENGWVKTDGRMVKNWEDLSEMEEKLSYFDNVELRFVNGHSGWLGNVMADKLARQGAQK